MHHLTESSENPRFYYVHFTDEEADTPNTAQGHTATKGQIQDSNPHVCP